MLSFAEIADLLVERAVSLAASAAIVDEVGRWFWRLEPWERRDGLETAAEHRMDADYCDYLLTRETPRLDFGGRRYPEP